jgi:hypothetical protein
MSTPTADAPSTSALESRSSTLLIVELVGLLIAFTLAVWLRLDNLGTYTGSFDEGIRSEQMLLMSAGYRPFREIFASQGPLLLDALYPFYLAFGQTLTAIRAGVVIFSLIGMAGAVWTARLLGGPVAAMITGLLMAVTPSYLESSRLALAETPSLAPALWSLGLAIKYQQTGGRGWLVASAITLAVAFLIKPMVIPVVGVAGLVVLLRRPVSLRSVIIFGLILIGVIAVVILALGPARVYEDLGAYRSGASRSIGKDAAENWRLTFNIISRDRLSLVALGVVGGAVALIRQWRAAAPVIAWPLAVMALFLEYDDLADKHIVYLSVPIILLAGCAGSAIIQGVAYLRQRQLSPVPLALAAAGSLAALGYADDLPRVWRTDQAMIHDAGRVAETRRDMRADLEIAEIMRRAATPEQFVLSDNPNASFGARRLVPPRLVDTSGTRIDAGSLTDALAISTAQEFQPRVIVTAPNRLGKLSAFVRSLTAADYDLVRTCPINNWKVYLRRDVNAAILSDVPMESCTPPAT